MKSSPASFPPAHLRRFLLPLAAGAAVAAGLWTARGQAPIVVPPTSGQAPQIAVPPGQTVAPQDDVDPTPTPAIVTSTASIARIESRDFVGAAGCASSMCHGGGPVPVAAVDLQADPGPTPARKWETPVTAERYGRNAYTIWSAKVGPPGNRRALDPHATSWVTMANPDYNTYSRQAGVEAARIYNTPAQPDLGSARRDQRCTVCHAPMLTVDASRLGPLARVEDGVSCESCHGPAREWLRSHTRHDITKAQRTSLGMRDLDNLYVRANNCIACHQVLPPEIAATQHPRLHFELHDQTDREGKHWRDPEGFFGPQQWLVGQAAALREMSWALSQRTPGAEEVNDWRALAWVLGKATATLRGGLPQFDGLLDAEAARPAEAYARAKNDADQLAKAAAQRPMDEGAARRLLRELSRTEGEFVIATAVPKEVLALRARRLTQALVSFLDTFRKQNQPRWKKAAEALGEMRRTVGKMNRKTDPGGFEAEKFRSQLQVFQREIDDAIGAAPVAAAAQATTTTTTTTR